MVVISSRANAAVKAARRLLRRSGRDRTGEFLVEGRGILDALPALVRVFSSPEADPALRERAVARGVEVVDVEPAILRELADTVTAQGVVGVARLPRPSLQAALEAAGRRGFGRGRVLVADGVADPGNAGTLIRTADAAGVDVVIFTIGSVDPRNPKTVRATAGSLFHLPVVDRVEPADLVTALSQSRLRLIGAAADGGVAHTGADLDDGWALAVGNEAHGLSDVLAAALDEVVSIPMVRTPRPGYEGVPESLNLAASAAVLLYESVRQRTAGVGLVPAGNRCEDGA